MLHLLLSSLFKEALLLTTRTLSLSHVHSDLVFAILQTLHASVHHVSHTHPKVSEQRCVRIGKHGVAGTQSLHVHISSEGGGGWVGQTVLLVVVRWRPGCCSRLLAGAGRRGCGFPRWTLQPSIADCTGRLTWWAADGIRAEDAWISKRSSSECSRTSRGTCFTYSNQFLNVCGNSEMQLLGTNTYLVCMQTGCCVRPHPKKKQITTIKKKWDEHVSNLQ